MPLIPQDTIAEILSRVDFQQIASEYLKLIRTGRTYKALCPFHQEKTPSFHIDPGKGLFYCFGCQTGGTVLDFLMQLEGFTYPDAIRHLSQKTGIPIPEPEPESAEQARHRSEKEQYAQVMNRAADLFEEALWASGGERARAVLKERGISEDTARLFRLGFAPDSWDAIIEPLMRTLGDDTRSGEVGLVKAGLALERRTGGIYARFRDRIMFPVTTVWGGVVAFSGRTLKDDEPAKYINSPETAYYTKGDHLYGLGVAKRAIKKRGAALLVEGNFDVVSMYQVGFQNVIAPLGTALTPSQTSLLKRYTDKVYLFFDGDAAGRKATYRSLAPLEKNQLRSWVVESAEGMDPDTLVRRKGVDAVSERLERAVPLIQFILDALIEPVVNQPIEERVRTMRRIQNALGLVAEEPVRQHYLEEAKRRLGVDPQPVAAPAASRDVHRTSRRSAMPYSDAEQTLVQLFMDAPALIESFIQEYPNVIERPELAEFLYRLSKEYIENPDGFEVARALAGLEESETVHHLRHLQMAPRRFQPEDRDQVLKDLTRDLILSWANREVSRVYQAIQQCRPDEDQQRFERLMDHRKKLTRLISEMKQSS